MVRPEWERASPRRLRPDRARPAITRRTALLRDQIFEHPTSLLAGCGIWIPIAIWVLALVQWAIQGDIDVLSAFVGIGVAIGLGGTALVARDPIVAPLIFVAVIGAMVVFPFARSGMNRRALNKIDVEAIEKAYELLRQRPGNSAAMFKLAKTIYNKGMPGHALALAEEAIQHMPRSSFEEEHRIVKGWRRYRMQPGQSAPLSCLKCNHSNRPGLVHCERCGAPFLLDHARGAWIGPGLVGKFIGAWAGIVLGLVGIPLAARNLPPGISIPVIIGLMVMAFVLVALAFRPKSQ